MKHLRVSFVRSFGFVEHLPICELGLSISDSPISLASATSEGIDGGSDDIGGVGGGNDQGGRVDGFDTDTEPAESRLRTGR